MKLTQLTRFAIDAARDQDDDATNLYLSYLQIFYPASGKRAERLIRDTFNAYHARTAFRRYVEVDDDAHAIAAYNRRARRDALLCENCGQWNQPRADMTTRRHCRHCGYHLDEQVARKHADSPAQYIANLWTIAHYRRYHA